MPPLSPVVPPFFETLEPRLLLSTGSPLSCKPAPLRGLAPTTVEPNRQLHPDLTGVIGDRNLPPYVQSGNGNMGLLRTVPVIITNTGNAPAVGTIAIELYVSQNQQLNIPPDTNAGTIWVPVNLAPGRSRTYNFTNVSVPPLAFGQYYLIANVDATNVINEGQTGGETNNAAVSPRVIEWRPPPVVFHPPAVLPPGRVGRFYTFNFGGNPADPSGGIGGPYHFQLATMGGFPPFGITLGPNGVLAGTPTVQGPRTFTVVAVDTAGNASRRSARGYRTGTRAARSGGQVTLEILPAADIIVTPTSGLRTTESGGTARFSVVLASPPTVPRAAGITGKRKLHRGTPSSDKDVAQVVISVASSDTSEGVVSTNSLTFTETNWKKRQTVTITGVDDPDVDGDQPYTIILGAAVSNDPAYNGLDPTDVSVTNADNDQPGQTGSFDGVYNAHVVSVSPLGTAEGDGQFFVANGFVFDAGFTFTGNVDAQGHFTGTTVIAQGANPIPMTGTFSNTQTFVISGSLGPMSQTITAHKA